MSKFYSFVIFLLFLFFTFGKSDYCYFLDDQPYPYFGTQSPYPIPEASYSIPAGCDVVFIWALIRHGTRYVHEKDQLTSDFLTTTRGEIIGNHETHKRGSLCKEDLESLKNWRYPWDSRLYGKLTPQGRRDMENLAENLKAEFSNFLKSTTKDKFKIQTSTRSRCQESAVSFTNELFGTSYTDVDENDIEVNNNMLRVSFRKKASDVDELNKFKISKIFDDFLNQMSSRLGYADKLNFDFARKLYKQCAFENALHIKSTSAFCSAFTPDHLKIMEYYEDMDSYYTLGYGEPQNKELACPLVHDLYKKFEHVRNNANPTQQVALYFAHNQILLPLITKLGFFKDSQPPKHDNYESLGDSRQWRGSFLSPFAGNLFAVMYKCSNEYTVSFYSNERLVKFSACPDGICLWKTLRDKFIHEILKECSEKSDSIPPADASGDTGNVPPVNDSKDDKNKRPTADTNIGDSKEPTGDANKNNGKDPAGVAPAGNANAPASPGGSPKDPAPSSSGGTTVLQFIKVQIFFSVCILSLLIHKVFS